MNQQWVALKSLTLLGEPHPRAFVTSLCAQTSKRDTQSKMSDREFRVDKGPIVHKNQPRLILSGGDATCGCCGGRMWLLRHPHDVPLHSEEHNECVMHQKKDDGDTRTRSREQWVPRFALGRLSMITVHASSATNNPSGPICSRGPRVALHIQRWHLGYR